MAKKSVVNYVRNSLQKGYSLPSIRNAMQQSGYSSKEIGEAINEAYKPVVRHEINFSKTTLAVVVIMIAAVGGALFYFNDSRGPPKLLDVNLEPVKTTVKAGESVVFVKELSNLGSSKRYDVVIKQEIIDTKTSKIVAQKTETRAIETFGSTQTKIEIPKDTKPGDYLLRAIVEYSDQKAIATLPVKITASSSVETCSDKIKNQNEEGVDCGGVCKECGQAEIEDTKLNCNDNYACTQDLVENGKCVYRQITPCCGNDICESGENCGADCRQLPEFTSTQSLEEIKENAKSNAKEAMKQCDNLDIPELRDTCIANIGEVQRNTEYCKEVDDARIKDLCYSNIAKLTNKNEICEEIVADSRKDSCYMTFVLDNKDYSVCDKIINEHLKQSCESLRQLNEINKQYSQSS